MSILFLQRVLCDDNDQQMIDGSVHFNVSRSLLQTDNIDSYPDTRMVLFCSK